ncbi:MAG: hypothetical protein ABI999_18715, partial [Acidobacteriota bacterium]
SDTTYAYDASGYTGTGQSLSSATQHDDTNYGTSFAYRGNLTSITRVDPTSALSSTSTSAVYNIAGSPISQTSPWDGTNTRTIRIGYTDVWNDGTTRYTYAYPTTITDPAGSSLGDSAHSSTVKYRFDTGANVEANSPAPTGQTYGKRSIRLFDSIGRPDRNSIYINTAEHSYVRYEYPTNGVQSKVYSTIVDTDADGADSDDEVLSESWTDGAGRTLRTRVPHAFSGGSTSTWSGTFAEYDILGRVARQSVPTEVNSSWTATGDDSTFLWTYQKYDWKGRIVRKINTDGTDSSTLNDTDVLISYEGCGCAGGQVTTVEGELVPRTDGTSGSVRRKQMMYQDILGRSYKTETYNWNGSVYSTIVNKYNGRDQVLQTTQYDGTTSSGTHQETTAAYDGFGRLSSSHKPEQQNSDTTAAYTTYAYNLDDSLATLTDARGTATNYTYNNQALPVTVHYTAPSGSGISVPSDVTLGYNNMGKRTSMTDALGTMAYAYDSLSEVTSETRHFSDTLSSGLSGNNYAISYTHQLNGQLASLTEPFGAVFNYGYDKVGRLTGVDPTAAYGDLTSTQSVVSGMQYRAFGSLKQVDYGNGTQATLTYNNRLQPLTYRLVNSSNSQILSGKDYYYTTGTNNDNDGRIKKSIYYNDTVSTTDKERNNRYYTYDSQGRVQTELTGELGVSGFFGQRSGPFQQTYHYDAFNNPTSIHDWDFGFNTSTGGPGCYGCPRNLDYDETVSNNRSLSAGQSSDDSASNFSITDYAYDKDGRLKTRAGENYSYDAPGNQIAIDRAGATPDEAYVFDGNGEVSRSSQGGAVINYTIKSTFLGVNLATLTQTGSLDRENVLSNTGAILANLTGGQVTLTTGEPAGESTAYRHMDKTGSDANYDPVGRTANMASPGGMCAPPVCYGPSGNQGGQYGGFDGLSKLANQIIEGRMHDKQYWNLNTQVQVGWSVGYKADTNKTSQKDFYFGQSYPQTPVTSVVSVDPIYGPNAMPIFFSTGVGGGFNPGKTGVQKSAGLSEGLSKCMVDLLAKYFPDYIVNGKGISIAADSRWIGLLRGIDGMTTGIYNIGYNATINLNAPNWNGLATIAEELAHAEQFVQMWQRMPDVEIVKPGRVSGNGRISYRRPTYREAQLEWAMTYVASLANTSLYWGSQYEIDAKKKATDILGDIEDDLGEDRHLTPCQEGVREGASNQIVWPKKHL